MEQQGGEDGAVALALDRVGLRRVEQFAGLVIAERRRLAFAAFRPRPLDAFDRVVGHGVPLAEILEQRGERGEPMPGRAAAETAAHQVVAPGDDVRARHRPKFFRPPDAGELHEVAHRVFVGAARVGVGDVGEPFDLGRHVGQPVKLGGGQQPVAGPDLCRELTAHDGRGRTMLPGGTPATLFARRYSAASASRSGPLGPQAMRRCWSRA